MRALRYLLPALTVFVALAFVLPSQLLAAPLDDPLVKRGVDDLRLENFEEADISLSKARDKYPDSSKIAYYLGITRKQMLDYTGAKENLSAATTLKPAVKEAYVELAEVHLHLEEFGDALRVLGDGERAGLSSPKSVFLKGMVLAKTGKNAEAVEAFKKSKKMDPKLAQSADYQTGLLQMKMGKYDEADKSLREAIIVDPNSDLAEFARGYVRALKMRGEKKARKKLRITAGIGMEFDDNVLLKPSDQTLAGSITNEDDRRTVLTFGLDYTFIEKGPFSARAKFSLYYTDHVDRGTHDISSQTFSLLPSYKLKKGVISTLVSHNFTQVEDNDYLDTTSINPSYTFVLKEGHLGQLGAKFQVKEYDNPPLIPDEDRDAKLYAAYDWMDISLQR